MSTVDLDALPIERVPAAIAHLASRLLTAPEPVPTGTDLLTVAAVAKLLNAGPRYVYRLVKANRLGAVRVSKRKLRFRRSAVERYLKERES